MKLLVAHHFAVRLKSAIRARPVPAPMATTDYDVNAETTTTFDLTKIGPDRLLVLFGGAAAIGFGALALVLQIMGESVPRTLVGGFSELGSAVFGFSIACVFGFGLLLAYNAMGNRRAEGSILALAFSIVLLAFGALPGLIAGIVGLVGALTGIVRNMKFVS